MTSSAGWFGASAGYLDSDSGFTSLEAALTTGGIAYIYSTAAPYYFIIDMKRSYTVTQVRGRSKTSVDPTDVDIYVSDDTASWGTAVATGITSFQDTDTWQTEATTSKSGRYVKVVVNSTEIADNIEWGTTTSGVYGIFDIYCTDLADCAEIVINLMNDQETTTSGSYVDTNFRIPWDGTKYDTLETAQLIVNAQGYTGEPAVPCYVQLYDFTNTTSLKELACYNYGATISVDDISMPAGAAYIGCRIKGATCTVRNAQLVLRLRAPVEGGDIKARIIRDVGWTIDTPVGASYTEKEAKRLYLDTSNYDGATYYFGAYSKVDSGGTGYIELYNNTDSSQLSELTWTETSYTYKMSSSISPTTNKEYTTRAKTSGFLKLSYPRCAHLIIDCDGLSKFEFDYLTAIKKNIGVKFTTNAYVVSSYICGYVDRDHGLSKTIVAEAVGVRSAGGDTSSARINSLSNSDTDYTTTTITRVRDSGGITEPDNYTEIECEGKGYTSSGGTLQLHCQRMIVQVTGFDTSDVTPTGTNCQINIGDAWKDIEAMQINIGDAWKDVASAQINIGDSWKTIF